MTFMTFVALWFLSFMMFVALLYDVCRIMTFVALWCLLHYNVCCIITFVVYGICPHMTFVALWRLSVRMFITLWHLSLMRFNAGLGICLLAHRLLLIGSFHSNQMSDCELFAQIAQDKWATVSKSLRLLWGNEQPWANCSGPSRQMSNQERFTQVAQRKWVNELFTQKMLAKKI